MSSPYGMVAPPAILINWSSAAGVWVATAVQGFDPVEISGPSSMEGSTPAAALQDLLTRRFCSITDDDCPATMVRITNAEPDAVA